VESLLEELELMGYLEIREGCVFAGPKAELKLKIFRSGLSGEEITALGW
jgi:hypothetical protein